MNNSEKERFATKSVWKPDSKWKNFGGHRWTREEELSWGIDFFKESAISEEKNYRDRRMKELRAMGTNFSGGTPLPAIVFSAVTFPYPWTSDKKLAIAIDCFKNILPNFDSFHGFTDMDIDMEKGLDGLKFFSSGDVTECSKLLSKTLVNNSSPRALLGNTPKTDPWGAFSIWLHVSTVPNASAEEDKAVLKASFTGREELEMYLDTLWDIPFIRRDTFWGDFVSSVGALPGFLYSHCYCGVNDMWGVRAVKLS